MQFKIAILASTQGTTLQAIIDAAKSGTLKADIACVIAEKECPALQRARDQGITAILLDKKQFPTREEFDLRLASILEQHGVSLVCLAGYMRLLSHHFVKRFTNRIINVHPSLLPEFAGGMDINVHKAVIESGVKETGCTIHIVDEGTDTGAIIAQEKVPVLPGDTFESLKQRVQEAERKLYPKVINLFAEKKVQVKDGKVRVL